MKLIWQKFKSQEFWRPSIPALISGFLVGTSYVPFPPWAVLFCWVPLWWHVLQKSRPTSQAFAQGWWAQFLLSVIGFHWISFVSHEFGFMPWPLAFFVLLVFGAFVHLHIPIALALGVWLKARFRLPNAATLVLIALLTALGEIYWPSLFPWHLGYTLLWSQSPIAQWADVVGFNGLSALLLLVNAALAFVFLTPSRILRTLVPALIFVSLAALTWGGVQHQTQWQINDAEIRILQIQANIGNFEKYQSEHGQGFQQQVLDQYFKITNQALQAHPDADLVVWPEAALPTYLDDKELSFGLAKQVREFVIIHSKPLLTGAFSHEVANWHGHPKNLEYNTLFLFDPQMHSLGSYRKTQLLAFGEYIPGEDWFPALESLNPNGGSFHRGPGPSLISFPWQGANLNLGPQICYESLDPWFSRSLALRGSELLVNITNDSWFGPRSEPAQHMIMTLARAVEVRRPMVRATNTGITTAILADGTQLERGPIGEAWSGLFKIPLKRHPALTFYTLYGGWLPLVLLALCVLMVVAFRQNSRQK